MIIDQNTKHLLIIDDDQRIRDLLKRYLNENNFLISIAADAYEALDLLEFFIFDLIIMDIMMPGMNGYELSAKIKSVTPIIMLSAMNDFADRVKGFETGVNDYLAKPFDPRELLFRINNILKINSSKLNEQYIKFGKFKYDKFSNRLYCNDKIISLTATQSKLLEILISNKTKIFTRSELAKLCRGINERSIDVQIIRLRNQIESDPKNPHHLQTIRNEGYVFFD